MSAIVDNIFQGQGQLARNTIPPFMLGYNDQVPMIEFSLDKAKALLAEAGFTSVDVQRIEGDFMNAYYICRK